MFFICTHKKKILKFFSPLVKHNQNCADLKMRLLRFTEGHRPRSRALKEFSLMSACNPVSARFTVTPPNRSTLPVSRSVPFTRCSWERTMALLNARTTERAGPDVLPHNRPVSSGRNLRPKLQEAIVVVAAKLTLVSLNGRQRSTCRPAVKCVCPVT